MMTSQLSELLRETNWEDSHVGTPASWPSLLIDTTRQISNTLLPSCILWSDSESVIYNIPFSNLLSNAAMGKPLRSLSDSFWDPIIAGVVDHGDKHPLLVDVVKVNGVGNDAASRSFKISISPLLTADGENQGTLLTLIETTEQVLAKRLAAIARENLHAIIRHAPVAMAALKGKDLIVEIANQKVCEMWGKPYDKCIGRPIFQIIPEVKDQGFEELVQQVMATGKSMEMAEVPVIKLHEGTLQQRYMTFSYEPLKNIDGLIDGIVTVGIDVTDSVQIREDFSQAEVRTQLVLEATAIGIFDLDLKKHEIVTSERFDEIFGVRQSSDQQTYLNMIHPDDLEEWQRTMAASLETGRLFQEYRIGKGDGNSRWVQTIGRV